MVCHVHISISSLGSQDMKVVCLEAFWVMTQLKPIAFSCEPRSQESKMCVTCDIFMTQIWAIKTLY
jgi:hypothetical protein